MDRKVLLISNYNVVRRPWNGVLYEFFKVISGMEDATVVAPGAVAARSPAGVARLGRDAALYLLGRGRGPQMRRTSLEGRYDLCLFMCQFSRDIPEVEQIREWRSRSRFAAAFVLETWSSEIEARRAALKVLDQFDHVFVLNAATIPLLRRYTSAPVSFLPTAVDCMLACPKPNPPARVIDVFSMGRRRNDVHASLLELSRERNLFYIYDVWTNSLAIDWAEARAANAAFVQRSRYFIAWDPASARPEHRSMIRDDGPISTRYFEGAAGGAILLGSRPASPEFQALFDWPDSVVEVGEGRDVRELLRELDADPRRVRAARRANIDNTLSRHDWAYRWDEVLAAARLPRTEAHQRRVEELGGLRAELASGAAPPRFAVACPA